MTVTTRHIGLSCIEVSSWAFPVLRMLPAHWLPLPTPLSVSGKPLKGLMPLCEPSELAALLDESKRNLAGHVTVSRLRHRDAASLISREALRASGVTSGFERRTFVRLCRRSDAPPISVNTFTKSASRAPAGEQPIPGR